MQLMQLYLRLINWVFGGWWCNEGDSDEKMMSHLKRRTRAKVKMATNAMMAPAVSNAMPRRLRGESLPELSPCGLEL